MAVPVPKGEDFGRRQRSRRTLVLAAVFLVYLALGGVVFGRLEVYEKERTVLRTEPAWRALKDHLNVTESAGIQEQPPPADDPGVDRTGSEQDPRSGLESEPNSKSGNESDTASRPKPESESDPRSDPAAESDSRLSSESVTMSRSSPDSESDSWTALKAAAVAKCDPETAAEIESLLDAAAEGNVSALETATERCGPGALLTTVELVEVNWSFIDAFFFCMTVITTIGYGHISPSSAGGQIFCIFYSLLGIPISGLLLAGLSDFFAGNLLNFYDSKWQKRWGESRWSLAGFTALYLLVGFLLFVFAPAVVFTWLEGWNYRESVYYAFITLSTIGFGDYTAAIANDDAWTTVYKVFVMLWVLIGLGYWVLVLNFLQKALKSKEVVAGLRQTSKLIAKEAEDIRQALVDAGILQRDAVFVPEHSKMTMNLMMNMSSMLAVGGPHTDGAGAEAGAPAPHLGEVRGIHSMGASLRSNSLLSALMASLPPSAAAAPQTPAAAPVTAEGAAALTPLLEQRAEESSVEQRAEESAGGEGTEEGTGGEGTEQSARGRGTAESPADQRTEESPV
ncbi:Open rectifier potassium channel protein 1 [Amphibalanus amphitrite]|uniref:Open rectifier potassium channel protein 1 n=1 Tax=Amphibalanus amphitrite TaxID=1232801 RepID=A0A6A4VPW7_AMPAM|nr:Open rectifier potassium channel protein 1 [Amphibalanus amphitrite]